MKDQEFVFEMDANGVALYRAGQQVPAGIYFPLEGGREVQLEQEDVLPATFDGHVAIYLRRPEQWREQQRAANPSR